MTAPAPARACGQRAPTAIEDVVMATPNMPVVAQRPMIEKVMGASPARRRTASDFPRPVRHGESAGAGPGDHDRAPGVGGGAGGDPPAVAVAHAPAPGFAVMK